MSKLKVKDISLDHLTMICNIINRGNQAEIKRERDNIVVVEIKRTALAKSPIEEDQQTYELQQGS